jgi:hypothetical protein|nr:MAG TPA: hypothetical protein [Caudoviricetes sp.]DAZ32765.1 MAG TPA: hypothetical protein [Caudoviricetes sp.]
MDINTLEETARKARILYNRGAITREEAKEMVKPYAEAFNRISAEIAAKYGRKPMKFSFVSFMR